MTDTLETLVLTIKSRRAAKSDTSYTRQLLDKGSVHCAKKFGEEAVEAVIAGVGQTNAELTSEAADVVYHLLVLLESSGRRLVSGNNGTRWSLSKLRIS